MSIGTLALLNDMCEKILVFFVNWCYFIKAFHTTQVFFFFSLEKFGRLVVGDEYVYLFHVLSSFFRMM